MPTLKAFVAAGAAAAFSASAVGLLTWHAFANIFSPHCGKLLVLAVFLTALTRWWNAGRAGILVQELVPTPCSLPPSERVRAPRPKLTLPKLTLPKLPQLSLPKLSLPKLQLRSRLVRVSSRAKTAAVTRTSSLRRRVTTGITRTWTIDRTFRLRFTLGLTRRRTRVVPVESESAD